ncbi:MAG: hypothetical protein HYV97_18240 [Bdellovibrio sp.]|nr:hypothetical protein [Bdellovibrio sp.]
MMDRKRPCHKQQQGSTTVEFLIFMPLVAAFMYFSHDLNVQLTNKQNLYLTNQTMFESNLADEKALQDFGKTVLKKMGGKCEIQIFLEEHKPDEAKLLARLSNNKLVGEDDATLFLQYQSLQQSQLQLATSYATQIGATILSAFPKSQQGIIQMTTLCPADQEGDTFAGSTHQLLSVFATYEENTPASFGEAAQLFFQKSSTYHADWPGDWSLLAQLLAVEVENPYGMAGALDLEEAHFQSYCMANLGSSTICGDIEFLWMDNPSNFAQYSYNLAQKKMALYDLLGEAEMKMLQDSLLAIGGSLSGMQNTFLDEAHTNKVIGQANRQQLEVASKLLHLKEGLSLPDVSMLQGLQDKLCLKEEVLP